MAATGPGVSGRRAARGRGHGIEILLRSFFALTLVLGWLVATGTWSSPARADGNTTTTTLTGTVSIIADVPGDSVFVSTQSGPVAVAGLGSERAAGALTTGQVVSVTVTTADPSEATGRVSAADGGQATVDTPKAVTAVPGTLRILASPPPTSGAVTAATAGPVTHRLDLVIATWPGSTAGDAATMASLRTAADEAAAYWVGASGGAINFTIVEHPTPVATTANPCLGGDFEALNEVYQSLGIDPLRPRTHLILAIPMCTEFPDNLGWAIVAPSPDWPGFVFLNGPRSTRPGTDGNSSNVVAHELGHNFTLHHANEIICQVGGVQVVNGGPADCRNNDYNGVYSVMGSYYVNKPGALGAYQSTVLGWTGPESMTTLAASPGRQTVQLAPAGTLTGRRFARFDDDEGNTYYLEYRTPVGQDSSLLDPGWAPHLAPAVLITKHFADAEGTPFVKASDPSWSGSTVQATSEYMLDANPLRNPWVPVPFTNLSDQFEGDAGIPANTVVRLGNVSLAITGLSAESATVNVTFDPATTPQTPPDPPTAVTAQAAGNASVRVSWTSPELTGGSPVSSYTVTSTPGGVTCIATGTTECLVTGLAAGSSYTFSVTATNALGTSVASTASPSVVLEAANSTPSLTGDTRTTTSAASPTGATTTGSTSGTSGTTAGYRAAGASTSTTTLAATGAGNLLNLAAVAMALLITGSALLVVLPSGSRRRRGPAGR